MTILSYFHPPNGDFADFDFAWPENGPATGAITGDSVSVIGWIPHFLREEDLPAGFLRDQWSRESSIPALLSTGNQRPPDLFDDHERGFVRQLDNFDFRGALAIAKPTLYTGLNGKPVYLRFSYLARSGFTTIRPSLFAPRLDWLQFFDGGYGEPSGVISESPDSISIRVFLRIKIGFVGQVFSVLQTKSWPPWATMMIDYTFDLRYQSAQVDFHGTAVPSQRRYIDWRRDSDYHIERSLTEAGYRGFVEAGGCRDALAIRTPTLCPVQIFPLSSEFTIDHLKSMRFNRGSQ